MEKKLVGYRRFTSKRGKDFCVANIISSYSQRELSAGCCGSKVEEIFLPDELYNLLTPKDTGKQVQLEYDIVSGRAYLVDFKVL